MKAYGIGLDYNDKEEKLVPLIACFENHDDIPNLKSKTFHTICPKFKYLFSKETLWEIKTRIVIAKFPNNSLNVKPCFTQDSENLILIKLQDQVPFLEIFYIQNQSQMVFRLDFMPRSLQINKDINKEILINGETNFLIIHYNERFIEKAVKYVKNIQQLFFTKDRNLILCVDSKELRVVSSQLIKTKKIFYLKSPITELKDSSIKNLLLIKQRRRVHIIDLITQKYLRIVDFQKGSFYRKQTSGMILKNGTDYLLQISDLHLCSQRQTSHYCVYIMQLLPQPQIFPPRMIPICLQLFSEIKIQEDNLIVCNSHQPNRVYLYKW